MQKVKGVLVAMPSKVRGALVAVPAAAMSGAAFAGDFATGITGTIDDTKADILLVGLAVLAVIVLIAAIGWVSRSVKK